MTKFEHNTLFTAEDNTLSVKYSIFKYNLNTPQLTVEYLATEKVGDDLKVFVGYLIQICIQ